MKPLTWREAKRITTSEIEYCFIEAHQLSGTETGDMSPEDIRHLDYITERLTRLLYKQVNENVEKPVYKNYEVFRLFEPGFYTHLEENGDTFEDFVNRAEDDDVVYLLQHKTTRFWIYQHESGKYSTEAGRGGEYGSLAACEKVLWDEGLTNEDWAMDEYVPPINNL